MPGARRAAFPNFGGDPETEFFLYSVAEDLITELGRAHWFSIVARNTSFNYKGNAADSKQIAWELGVPCVVEGILREAGSRSGSVASSFEAASGQHLWVDRFDGTLDDSFDLQDRITESVIGSVGRAAQGRDRTRPAQARDGTRRS